MPGNATKEAIADAMAGVSGSLVAMLTFYPIDVIKTNLQASSSTSSTYDHDNTTTILDSNKKQRNKRYFSIAFLRCIFRGLHYKTAHTITSSFTYFFIYSFIKSHYKRYSLQKQQSRKIKMNSSYVDNTLSSSSFSYQPSTSMRLFLSAIAGMVNVTMTLPLDVLAARSQTQSVNQNDDEITNNHHENIVNIEEEFKSNQYDKEIKTHHKITNINADPKQNDIMEQVWNDVVSSEENNNDDIEYKNFDTKEDVNIESMSPSKSQPLFRIDSFFQPIPNEYLNNNTNGDFNNEKVHENQLSTNQNRSISSLQNIFELWNGITPALLLCSNPSINFTVYDVVKEHVLSYKRNRLHMSKSSSGKITMMEAFCIGLIAKFAATVATYPLIRAKVMLMVAKKKYQKKEVLAHKSSSFDSAHRNKNSSKKSEMASMIQILCHIYTKDGIKGLYKGCGLQLIHTMLKSALLMMVRERIAATTKRLIVG